MVKGEAAFLQSGVEPQGLAQVAHDHLGDLTRRPQVQDGFADYVPASTAICVIMDHVEARANGHELAQFCRSDRLADP